MRSIPGVSESTLRWLHTSCVHARNGPKERATFRARGDSMKRRTAPVIGRRQLAPSLQHNGKLELAPRGTTNSPRSPLTSFRSNGASHQKTEEFFHPSSSVTFSSKETLTASSETVKTSFCSPPLLPGLLKGLRDVLGPRTRPTPIQALSMQWIIEEGSRGMDPENNTEGSHLWKQFLLASETGSGKSIAYLLPVLQALKEGEMQTRAKLTEAECGERAVAIPNNKGPRALVLAPTHELARQLAAAAKALLHSAKLRVQCASRENVGGSRIANVDLLVGTPKKLFEMTRAKVNLQDIEWVVVDEADVLFDPDFKDETTALLSDISKSRKGVVANSTTSQDNSMEIEYPFNLILASATIPVALESHLRIHYPRMLRLASPRLHRLPPTLRTERATWSGGNKLADIERRVREVWRDDAVEARMQRKGVSVGTGQHDEGVTLSKILIFCNKATRADQLAAYLEERGIRCVALSGSSEARKRGSNNHLDGFLRVSALAGLSASPHSPSPPPPSSTPSTTPHVLITTSLLSRGLDFDPNVRHVFLVDRPRNALDFLHRAGRSGRAGEKGTVVVFEKGKGTEKGVLRSLLSSR